MPSSGKQSFKTGPIFKDMSLLFVGFTNDIIYMKVKTAAGPLQESV